MGGSRYETLKYSRIIGRKVIFQNLVEQEESGVCNNLMIHFIKNRESKNMKLVL